MPAPSAADARIGILYQNDDLGRDFVAGAKDMVGVVFIVACARALLATAYVDAALPKLVRRRILETAVRAPEDWHQQAVRGEPLAEVGVEALRNAHRRHQQHAGARAGRHGRGDAAHGDRRLRRGVQPGQERSSGVDGGFPFS